MKTIYLVSAILFVMVFFACKKENDVSADMETTKQTSKKTSTTNTNSAESQSTMRMWDASIQDCNDNVETCFPDLVITPHLSDLLTAFELEDFSDPNTVSQYFQDEETALEFFPNWNDLIMADVKDKILSGDYAFYKEEYDHAKFYFLGTTDDISNHTFEYVFPFAKQSAATMRMWDASIQDCNDNVESCFPDVIITPHLSDLLTAFELEDISDPNTVYQYFQDEETALEFFPNWNDAIMTDVRTKIVSGNGAFYMEEYNNKKFYFFGTENMVQNHEFTHVFPYAY